MKSNFKPIHNPRDSMRYSDLLYQMPRSNQQLNEHFQPKENAQIYFLKTNNEPVGQSLTNQTNDDTKYLDLLNEKRKKLNETRLKYYDNLLFTSENECKCSEDSHKRTNIEQTKDDTKYSDLLHQLPTLKLSIPRTKEELNSCQGFKTSVDKSRELLSGYGNSVSRNSNARSGEYPPYGTTMLRLNEKTTIDLRDNTGK